MTYNFGIFSTGRDREAIELFNRIWDNVQKGVIKGRIAYVFCNREEGEDRITDSFIRFVRRQGIDLVTFSSDKFKPEMRQKGVRESSTLGKESPLLSKWRDEYDREVISRLPAKTVDIFLVGYMLIIGPAMCNSFNIINLHPSPPGGPEGSWQEVIRELIERDADDAGCMMHLVTPELDKGPPITYCTFSIKGNEYDKLWENYRLNGDYSQLFAKIRENEYKREGPLLIETIKAFAEKKIWIEKGKVMTQSGEVSGGYCLNEVIHHRL